MAFHFFLSLIPLLVVIGYLLGLLVRQRGVDAFIEPFLEASPGIASDVVKNELERLAGKTSSPLAPLGIAGFLWVAASGAHGLMNVFETMLGAQRRPWWKKRLMGIAWVATTISVFCFAAWGVLTVDARIHKWEGDAVPVAGAPANGPPVHTALPSEPGGRAAAHADPRPVRGARPLRRRAVRLLVAPWERGAAMGVMLILAVCGLAAFFRYSVKHAKGVKRRAWPGALTAVVAWLLVSWGFGAYVASLSSYALFYGSLAAVAVLLIWAYLTSLALLLGAEVNAQLEGVRDAVQRAEG